MQITFNLTSEILPTTATKPVRELPQYIRRSIQRKVETQQTAPRRKAVEVAALLQSMEIKPDPDTRFYVGNGNSSIGGYTVFRACLRKMGYNVVTKV